MSSSTHPWHNEDEAVSSNDDDLLDLEFLDFMEEEKKCHNRPVIRFPGDVHNKFASWDEAYNAWLAYTGQVEQIVPPPVLPSIDDAAGSSSEYTPPGRVSFPLWLILAMTFCFIVVVATVIFYLF
ncbi:hypothetical protein RHSIM_Rhsim11G0027200 [Rhododendron simsii]|uniref:Uncharacterized protein n=1 Tax=Rhododendron simsii TaxID=118357 RepID=A0A834LB39_RHOSS|nr:hypothetical protein RHSIM_Rhsim11G0027200 [Rhododendron simsii]